MHAHDALLPDWSHAARRDERQELRALRERLDADHPLPQGGLDALAADAMALDAELARANIDVRLAESDSGFFVDRNPALWTGEAIFGPVSLMIRPFAAAAERVVPLAARLAAIPDFLAQMRGQLDRQVPAGWMQRAKRECAAARQLFTDGLATWLSVHGIEATQHGLRQVADNAAGAFADTQAWLATRPASDADAYSCGAPLMATLLQRGHFCDRDARDLLVQAESAVASASVELTAALAETIASSGGTWAAAQAAMRADAPSVDDFYRAFARRWDDIHAAVQSRDVVTWPEWPIRYVPISGWARAAAPSLYWLFYRSPAPFDPYDVYEYVVTPVDASLSPSVQQARLEAWNHSVITLNHVVHHGGIGHHVQNWHARHRATSRIGAVSAVDAASRIGMFLGGSMAEGWACYATALVGELGLLTPLEVLSDQHTRVRLAARAVVDLRLHLGDWSFAECVAYYQRVVGMTVDVAEAEATKNSMFPATALMYWLGSTGIAELRSRLEQSVGGAFSLKVFHDAVLGYGAIPVPLMARLVWQQMAAAPPSSMRPTAALP